MPRQRKLASSLRTRDKTIFSLQQRWCRLATSKVRSRRFLRQHCLPNYLYGVIMLSKGETAIGQAMLDTLRWRENKRRADACWRRIKRSLHGITVTTLESYMTNYLNTRATITCHWDKFTSAVTHVIIISNWQSLFILCRWTRHLWPTYPVSYAFLCFIP